jgi:hypothetical protein
LFYFGENLKITVKDVRELMEKVVDADVLLMHVLVLQNECSAGDEIMRLAKKAGMIICFNAAPR